MEIKEKRKTRLEQLLAEEPGPPRGKKQRLAKRLGKAPAQISQWLSGYRTIDEDTARDMERKARKPAGWLDGTTIIATGGTARGSGARAQIAAPSPPALPAALPVAATVERLGALLAAASPETRAAVASLLLEYAKDPAGGERIVRAIETLLGVGTP